MTETDPEQDLSELLAAAQRGDSSARAALMEAHLPGLHAYVRLKTPPQLRMEESCSDLAQSVCAEVIQNLDQFEYRGTGSFRSWLFTAAAHKIVDRLRYFRAERRDVGRKVRMDRTRASQDGLLQCYAKVCTPSRDAVQHENIARIEAALDRLSQEHREVIVLSRLLGLPHREVALRMERTEQASRTLLRRALVRLSAVLDR